MKLRRVLLSALLLPAVTFALVSCSSESSPTGPAAQKDLLSSTLHNLGLLSCTPMQQYSATQTIGPAGGVMHVGPHTFIVPPGALHSDVTITAVAPHDNVNRVEFSPEGLTFAQPAALTMSYANCNLLGILLPKHIAYVDHDLNILYYLLSLDNIFSKQVTGQVNHFSEYALAW
jgi:hypothetical protein